MVEVIRSGTGKFVHGFTYSGMPLVCFVGNTIFDIVEHDGLVDRSRRVGAYLLECLTTLEQKHEMIGQVRGLGLLAGIEFVADRATRRPFDQSLQVTERVVRMAEERGLLLRQGAAGSNFNNGGDHVQISPAYVISETEVDEVVSLLDATLDAVLASL